MLKIEHFCRRRVNPNLLIEPALQDNAVQIGHPVYMYILYIFYISIEIYRNISDEVISNII